MLELFSWLQKWFCLTELLPNIPRIYLSQKTFQETDQNWGKRLNKEMRDVNGKQYNNNYELQTFVEF